MTPHTETGRFVLRDFPPRWIAFGIPACPALKASGRACSFDMLKDGFITLQRLPGPIGTDQVEHVVFDGVHFDAPVG
jgi:hypothetical protein